MSWYHEKIWLKIFLQLEQGSGLPSNQQIQVVFKSVGKDFLIESVQVHHPKSFCILLRILLDNGIWPRSVGVVGKRVSRGADVYDLQTKTEQKRFRWYNDASFIAVEKSIPDRSDCGRSRGKTFVMTFLFATSKKCLLMQKVHCSRIFVAKTKKSLTNTLVSRILVSPAGKPFTGYSFPNFLWGEKTSFLLFSFC